MIRSLLLLFLLLMMMSIQAQEIIDLYPQGQPNMIESASRESNQPEFYFYKPTLRNYNKVFLIIPGGGYSRVAMGHEGHDVAKRLKSLGYASFVLRYRLPNDTQQHDKRIAPIQDAQTALAYIKSHQAEYGLDDAKVVVLGFSAGGHVASILSNHFETSYVGAVDLRLLRPDYSVLVYPVISMKDGLAHPGSKFNLIGPGFLETDVNRFSSEEHVSALTPPTFLVHSDDDNTVPIQNSLLYQEKLYEMGVDHVFFRYKKGVHGFGLYNKQEDGDWFLAMLNWLALK